MKYIQHIFLLEVHLTASNISLVSKVPSGPINRLGKRQGIRLAVGLRLYVKCFQQDGFNLSWRLRV
jgi:hypothetical protein